MAAVSQHALAIKNELSPTPAAGTAMPPWIGRQLAAMAQLREAERTGNTSLGFLAIRELMEILFDRELAKAMGRE